jgi:hypothetical protein
MTISANFSTTRPSLLLDFSNQTVLDPRVTFARTTTALFYDNKSAALAEQNLLTYSNTFTNAAWTKDGVGTPVLNATDPTGTASGAYTVTATVGSGNHTIYNVSASSSQPVNTYTVSIYLQAGTSNFATVSMGISTNYAAATFNLTTGVLTQSGSSGFTLVGTPSITQIGSTAWYRCSVSASIASSSVLYLFAQINNAGTFAYSGTGLQAAWTAAGTETLLVYGAQLEQRSLPTVYTATTATAVNTYTPTLQTAAINAPRFDYNPTTRESLGLLLEQAATNLALYSSDYTNAAWTKTACTITATADISPDGTQNASLMVLSTASAFHQCYQQLTLTAATYTYSAYVKYYGLQFVQIASSGAVNYVCNFDLLNGTAGTPSGSGATASIQNAGNGWYRCSITYTGAASAYNHLIIASNSLTATFQPTFTGNGFNGYLIWGAQVELAPSATSYIATVASAQTRTTDAASMTGTNFTSWYNYSGGTVYVEAAYGNPPASGLAAIISDNTQNNNIFVGIAPTGIQTYVNVNNVLLRNVTVATPSTPAANTFYKTAFYFSGAGVGVSSVGQTATTAATAVTAPAVNQLSFSGSGYWVTNQFNGRIKKFAYYPLPLTNTQIQSLSAN